MIIAASIIIVIVALGIAWWLSGKILNRPGSDAVWVYERAPDEDPLDSVDWPWGRSGPFDYEKSGI